MKRILDTTTTIINRHPTTPIVGNCIISEMPRITDKPKFEFITHGWRHCIGLFIISEMWAKEVFWNEFSEGKPLYLDIKWEIVREDGHLKDNAPFTIDGVAQMIRNLGKSHSIRLSPHKLRHSFAISFLRNGANPFELQIALGHTTLEMTRRYTQALGFEDVFKRHVLASPVDRMIKWRCNRYY